MARWAIAASSVLVFVGIGAIPSARSDSDAQVQSRIGLVNSETILRQTPGYEAADSILGAERQIMQQEANALRQQLDSAMAAFDQQQLVLSPQARQERMDELQALSNRADQRFNELNQRDVERQRELVAPLEQRIQAVIDGVRAERNLSIVFDVANPASGIISVDPALDLTGLVISRLQSAGGQ